MQNPKSVSTIELSQLIDALRNDLLASAARRSKDWQPLFDIGEVIVEAAVEFERDMEAGGKISVLVAAFSPKATEKSSATHRMSIKLLPVRVADSAPAPSSLSDGATPNESPRLVVTRQRKDPLLRGDGTNNKGKKNKA